jgi:dTDP-glucose 4,6-dehydratase
MQGLRGEPLTIYGDGQQTRSFCYVSDLIEGILHLSRTDERFPVNLGNPNEFTVLESTQEVIEVTGCISGIRFESAVEDHPSRRQPDITKARALLGWEPQITLREGLELSLPWFRTHV